MHVHTHSKCARVHTHTRTHTRTYTHTHADDAERFVLTMLACRPILLKFSPQVLQVGWAWLRPSGEVQGRADCCCSTALVQMWTSVPALLVRMHACAHTHTHTRAQVHTHTSALLNTDEAGPAGARRCRAARVGGRDTRDGAVRPAALPGHPHPQLHAPEVRPALDYTGMLAMPQLLAPPFLFSLLFPVLCLQPFAAGHHGTPARPRRVERDEKYYSVVSCATSGRHSLPLAPLLPRFLEGGAKASAPPAALPLDSALYRTHAWFAALYPDFDAWLESQHHGFDAWLESRQQGQQHQHQQRPS